jgi:hypothetical protein
MTCPVCGNPTSDSKSCCELCGAELGARPTKKKRKKPLVKTVNIKEDMPTAEQARERMRNEIQSAKQGNVRLLKLIHGYGSSGKGGVLQQKLRPTLRKMEKEGLILGVLIGEQFHQDSEGGRFFLKRYPELVDDSDYKRNNPGITLIALS